MNQYTQPVPPVEDETPVGLIVAGYVTAILIPIVGFILGIVAITRHNSSARKNGVGIVVTSVVMFVIWTAVFVAATEEHHASSGVSVTLPSDRELVESH